MRRIGAKTWPTLCPPSECASLRASKGVERWWSWVKLARWQRWMDEIAMARSPSARDACAAVARGSRRLATMSSTSSTRVQRGRRSGRGARHAR